MGPHVSALNSTCRSVAARRARSSWTGRRVGGRRRAPFLSSLCQDRFEGGDKPSVQGSFEALGRRCV